MSDTSRAIHVGIDLGGTFVKLALVTARGEPVAEDRFPTDVPRGPDAIIAEMAERCRELWQQQGFSPGQIDSVGVGSPGPLDPETGVIHTTPNLKWENVPLREILESRLEIPVAVENDAVAATFGEWWGGAGKTFSDVVGLTLGTGVGGGIVIDGKPHRGFLGSAGHIGHTVIESRGRPCPCGNRGCLEAYASATAIVARARERMEEEGDQELERLADSLTSRALYQAALQGNELARDVFRETAFYLAVGIHSVMNILNPEVVVLMGAVANAGDLLMDPLERQLAQMTFADIYPRTRVVLGALGEYAGVVGAAGLARLRFH